MPRSWIFASLAFAAVLVGVGMIVLGLPEATPAQIALLELSSLPLSAALGLGVAHLASKLRPLPGVSLQVLLIASSGGVLVGLAVILTAYVVGPRSWVHLGQLVIWMSLLAALVAVVSRLPRRGTARFELAGTDAESAPVYEGESSL